MHYGMWENISVCICVCVYIYECVRHNDGQQLRNCWISCFYQRLMSFHSLLNPSSNRVLCSCWDFSF